MRVSDGSAIRFCNEPIESVAFSNKEAKQLGRKSSPKALTE
jgi:hypothetical protein